MQHKNFLTIVIACRNGTNYLAEAIAGLRRQDMDMEIIVVDDGSTDDTAKLAADLDCVVRSIPHSGTSAARNVGIGMAHGEFILFHDHDDIMRPEALRRMFAELLAHPSAAAVMAMAEDFISPELSDKEKALITPRETPYSGYLSGAILFRRSVLDALKGFDEGLAVGQVVDFLLRLQQSDLEILRLNHTSVGRRLHPSSLSRTQRKQEFKDYAMLLRQRSIAAKRERERPVVANGVADYGEAA